MRTWMWIVLTAACGQAYQTPGGQIAQPQTAPATVPAGPGVAAVEDPEASVPEDAADAPGAGGREDPSEDGAAASYRASGDATAGARAAGAPRTRRGASRPASGEAAAWVDAHNQLRAKHCAGALTWSSKLAGVAQRWANSLRDRGCQFGHSGGSYGENLAAGTSGILDPESVVKMWYDEISQYRFPNGGFSMKTGHFTQVVWRGTTQVGCARSQCKGLDIYVCEYDPPGNWEGQYRENVRPAGCR